MADSFDVLRGHAAIACRRQIHGEQGGATVHCVVLSDGFIVDLGSDGYAKKRAQLLADAINATGPEKFALGRIGADHG